MNYSPLFRFSSYRRVATFAIFALIFTALSGCSTIKGFFDPSVPDDINFKLPAETLVKKGMDDYNRGKYFMALEYFNKVLENHRFTPQALMAELKVADCSFYMENYIEAQMYYEKFQEMHPTNEAIPYVMYQKAMCYYKRIDIIDRDTTGALKSVEKFQQLLKVYPDSPYSEDARSKIEASKEFLADHEYGVAKFYIRTDQYSQAIIRLKYLIAMYPMSKITPKAWELLNELEVK
jgi:outer membrane protein assembly factor BamD